MTYNIKWAKRDAARHRPRHRRNNKPDLLLMQDAGADTWTELGTFLKAGTLRQWTSTSSPVICRFRTATFAGFRTPIRAIASCALSASRNGRDIALYSCHLAIAALRTVRDAPPPRRLRAVGSQYGFCASAKSQRLAEHARDETLPVLLGGDLNAPMQSIVCKNLFAAGMDDAFSAAGNGYGYTYGTTTKVGSFLCSH